MLYYILAYPLNSTQPLYTVHQNNDNTSDCLLMVGGLASAWNFAEMP